MLAFSVKASIKRWGSFGSFIAAKEQTVQNESSMSVCVEAKLRIDGMRR